ncbi:MAG: efflux RND transporter periplasmic adaptor subunit [Bryobacteraceae bacterium]
MASSCTKETKAEAPAEVPTVAVAKVSVEDLAHSLVLTAEFKPFQEIDVMAKVAGYVKKINVDVGDRVAAGQLLATLEIPEMGDDITRAQASVERSSSEVTRAKDEVQRAESAHQMSHISYERISAVSKKRPGLVAQQEIDDAHGRDLVSEAQVSAAKSALDSAVQQVNMNKADQGRTKTMFEYTRVTAPFAGVITKRYADTGSMIQAGTASQTQAMPLVRLSQNSLLRLILPVPESAVPRIHVGQQVEVRVPSLDRNFPGKVARFSEKVQSSSRTMETEVDVANGSLVLVPGMYAEVNLTMERRDKALAIPAAAVGESKVMVVTAGNTLQLRPVELGIETANFVEVRSGLQEGEMVVIGNTGGLQVGQHVKPKLIAMTASKEGR